MKKLRKPISFILSFSMAFSLLVCGTNAAANPSITSKELPFYILSPETEATIDVYYMGDSDVPYLNLEDWAELMTVIQTGINEIDTYSLTYTFEDDDTGVLTREDGYTAAFDCGDDTITFYDYDAFRRPTPNRSLLDVLSVSDPLEGEAAILFKRVEGTYDRYGDILVLDLGAYGINMVASAGRVYVPMQTLSDFFIAPDYVNIFYNGESVILAGYNSLGEDGGHSPLGELLHSVGSKERSEAMAEYSYAELCLVLDNFYGLKDAHDIKSFDTLAMQAGLKDGLLSLDPDEADAALFTLISYYLDDLHSAYNDISPFSTPGLLAEMRQNIGRGFSEKLFVKQYLLYSLARIEARPEGIPGYEEIGNTAYITFDGFSTSDADYYHEAPTADAEDTIGLMLYAYAQVMRENSPIENVVLDLSCNLGGDADAAVFVISAFLGEGSVSMKNTMTGAMSTAVYRVDMNLDNKFDDGDLGFTEKNLYCLISPVSFSCGNLVPNAFKNSNMVTLIGRTSGGGSCVVQPMSTAYGTSFQISGFSRLAFIKNGSFYDIDRGATPDFSIMKPASFYDRTRLTAFILSLP